MQQQPLTPEQIQAIQGLRNMGNIQPNPNIQRLPNTLNAPAQVGDMVNYIPNEVMNNPALAEQYNRERMNLLAQPVSGAEQALIQNLRRQEMMSAGVPTGFAASAEPQMTSDIRNGVNTLRGTNYNINTNPNNQNLVNPMSTYQFMTQNQFNPNDPRVKAWDNYNRMYLGVNNQGQQ